MTFSRTLVVWAASGLLVSAFCLVALTLWRAGQAADESVCIGKMAGLTCGFGYYYRIHGSFPPEYMDRPDGTRRSVQEMVNGAGDLPDEQWECPFGSYYCPMVGWGRVFDGARALAVGDITDGCANTLLLVELSKAERDALQSPAADLDGIAANVTSESDCAATQIHRGGRGLVFADGLIFRLVKPLKRDVFKALLTRSGGEGTTRKQLIAQGFLVDCGWHSQIPGSGDDGD